MHAQTIGVIGGSGLYELEGLERVERQRVPTPYGETSDLFVTGVLGPHRLYFLPRHGVGHVLPPQAVPFRANLWALKQLGVQQVISLSAVGSLRESLPPGHLVIPDQLVDRTYRRATTFFDEPGAVAHVSLADPFDHALSGALAIAAESTSLPHQRGGTYLCMEGPQFSTRAESEMYRQLGFDIIGMTNGTEARLALEAELPYASACFVTDYDCWHDGHDAVTVDMVLAQLRANSDAAKSLLRAVVDRLPDPAASPASRALDTALVTPVDAIDEAAKDRLAPILARRLSG